MIERQLLHPQFQQLITHSQVSNTQRWQGPGEYDQRQVFRLVAQEKTHRFMDSVIGNQMIVIDDQIKGGRPNWTAQ